MFAQAVEAGADVALVTELDLELLVGRCGAMEGYCPRLRKGQVSRPANEILNQPPVAATNYVRQVLCTMAEEYARARLWALIRAEEEALSRQVMRYICAHIILSSAAVGCTLIALAFAVHELIYG